MLQYTVPKYSLVSSDEKLSIRVDLSDDEGNEIQDAFDRIFSVQMFSDSFLVNNCSFIRFCIRNQSGLRA